MLKARLYEYEAKHGRNVHARRFFNQLILGGSINHKNNYNHKHLLKGGFTVEVSREMLDHAINFGTDACQTIVLHFMGLPPKIIYDIMRTGICFSNKIEVHKSFLKSTEQELINIIQNYEEELIKSHSSRIYSVDLDAPYTIRWNLLPIYKKLNNPDIAQGYRQEIASQHMLGVIHEMFGYIDNGFSRAIITDNHIVVIMKDRNGLPYMLELQNNTKIPCGYEEICSYFLSGIKIKNVTYIVLILGKLKLKPSSFILSFNDTEVFNYCRKGRPLQNPTIRKQLKEIQLIPRNEKPRNKTARQTQVKSHGHDSILEFAPNIGESISILMEHQEEQSLRAYQEKKRLRDHLFDSSDNDSDDDLDNKNSNTSNTKTFNISSNDDSSSSSISIQNPVSYNMDELFETSDED